MGGHSSSSTTKISSKMREEIDNILDQSVNIHNEYGVHDITAGDLGRGTTVYLQNLQSVKPQLQNLGANAVYIPDSNQLVLLAWA